MDHEYCYLTEVIQPKDRTCHQSQDRDYIDHGLDRRVGDHDDQSDHGLGYGDDRGLEYGRGHGRGRGHYLDYTSLDATEGRNPLVVDFKRFMKIPRKSGHGRAHCHYRCVCLCRETPGMRCEPSLQRLPYCHYQV